jgi:hypothetical protein
VDALGCRWRRAHGGLIPHSFPHELESVNAQDARTLRAREHARLIRWESDFDGGQETDWWHVIKDAPDGLMDLKPKVRNAVRQGLRDFDVGKVSRQEILSEGYEVYVAAYARYETFEPMLDATAFSRAVESMPAATEFWAVRARDGSGLLAFAENVVGRDACFYSTMWFSPRALKGNGSYALIHCMNEHYLGERGMRYVSDGARNISHQTNVHQFLQDKFGFRKAYCRLHVEYAPWVAGVVAAAYPMREWLRRHKVSARLDVLLEQERIRRACAEGGR